MMRYAIISDIHGNREALDVCLSDARHQGVDAVLCLGDLIGYGPDPNEVVERVREEADIIVGGNHDAGVVINLELFAFTPYARASIEWTRGVLTPANRRFLGELRVVAQLPDALLVHSSPNMPREWRYMATVADVEENFMAFSEKTCFVGHTHFPMIMEKGYDGSFRFFHQETVDLAEGARYIVNVGSVGQPRDGDARACYVVYDARVNRVTTRRVAYNFRETQEKMKHVRLPGYLVDRLEAGR